MANQTAVMEFLLMGFSNDPNGQILHFVMFLFIYVLALSGNILLITVVVLNRQLHTPMYFFLLNLSLSDICLISITIPNSMATSLTNSKLISFHGCVTQVFLAVTCLGVDLALLTVMAYDRYVAICHPLKYTLIMNWDACAQMAAASWLSSVIHAVIETGITFRLNFCGSNIIEQFFCDIPQLLKISCMDPKANEILILVLGLIVVSFCFVCVFVSYGYIFSVVLKIPSVQGRHKAFSTCTPHLLVISLFMLTSSFSYLRPKALSSSTVDLLSAVLYVVLPSVLNPIIYSLRNKDIQQTLYKISIKVKRFIASSCRSLVRKNKGTQKHGFTHTSTGSNY